MIAWFESSKAAPIFSNFKLTQARFEYKIEFILSFIFKFNASVYLFKASSNLFLSTFSPNNILFAFSLIDTTLAYTLLNLWEDLVIYSVFFCGFFSFNKLNSLYIMKVTIDTINFIYFISYIYLHITIKVGYKNISNNFWPW